MSDQPMFVQFGHGGGQHVPPDNFMPWNVEDHARKFMLAQGDRITSGSVHTGPLCLWGEWEPPSRVLARWPRAPRDMPRILHEPLLVEPAPPHWRQNTDPLVFGGTFHYSNCRQNKNRKLRALAPGSIIVFGSKLQGRFVADTVLVIASSSTFSLDDVNPSDYPHELWDVVMDPVSSGSHEPGATHVLYDGVKYEGIDDEPFSFVPCQSWEPGFTGFPRPTLALDPHWINPSLSQAAKATPASPNELRKLWLEIRRQVTEIAGLDLAVRLDWPQAVRQGSAPTTGPPSGDCAPVKPGHSQT